jgi:YD repeat-containing protein
MILTKEYLQKYEACQEAIDFFERNYPEGLDLDRWTIHGDFKNWVSWLNNCLRTTLQYDDHGNVIKKIYPNGDIYQWEYDDRENVIKKIDLDGNVSQYEYDDRGNKIKEIYPNGDVYQWEYDRGNRINIIISNKKFYQLKYDVRGNKTKEISQNGNIW